MDPNFILTGVIAFTAGVAGLVTANAVHSKTMLKRIEQVLAGAQESSDLLNEQLITATDAAISRTAHALEFANKVAEVGRYEDRIFGLNEANKHLLQRAQDAEKGEAAAVASVDSYMQVVSRQQSEIDSLRAQNDDLTEQRDDLEVELRATKIALETEGNQASLWAATAKNLGWSPTAVVPMSSAA